MLRAGKKFVLKLSNEPRNGWLRDCGSAALKQAWKSDEPAGVSYSSFSLYAYPFPQRSRVDEKQGVIGERVEQGGLEEAGSAGSW